MSLSKAFLAGSDQSIIISTRLAILLTCKEWYAASLHILWSHLLFASSAKKDTVIAVYNAVRSKALVASSVRRLTVLATTAKDYEANESLWKEYADVIRLLPNMEILVCPHRLTINLTIPSKRLQVVHLLGSLTLGMAYTTDLFEDGWNNVRVLTLCANRVIAGRGPEEMIEFPNLTHLRLDISTIQNILHTSTRWEIPNIQVLALKSSNFEDWLPFMRRHGSKLRRMEICNPNHVDIPHVARWGTVQFTRLVSLFTTPGTVALDDLDAPNLSSFGIFYIPGARSDGLESCVGHVDAALERYPKLRAVHLLGKDSEPLIGGTELALNQHVRRWMNRGVMLEE